MKTKTLFIGIVLLLSWTSALAQGGTTGPLTWNINDGTLIISGNGEMPDYYFIGSSGTTAPWNSYIVSITTIIIRNGVTRIGNLAFCYCWNLISSTIPNSVTDIGDLAFYNCYALTSITNLNPIPVVIKPNVFYGVDKNNCMLKVPKGSVSDYQNAPVWKDFLHIESIVGIEPIEASIVKVYPNPTRGELRIKSEKLSMRNICIFDMTGRLVLEMNHVDNNEARIDLSNYADGVYFLKIDGQTVKVVKQ